MYLNLAIAAPFVLGFAYFALSERDPVVASHVWAVGLVIALFAYWMGTKHEAEEWRSHLQRICEPVNNSGQKICDFDRATYEE